MAPARCSYGEEDLLPVALGQTASEEFQAHLADCPDCRQRLEQLRSESSLLRQVLREREGSGPSPPAAAPLPGEVVPGTIGKYFVVGKAGQGGQAIIYRALHPELQKEVLIKYGIEPIPVGAVERDLLVREGRLLAGLDHPNLVRIIDLDFHEARPFVVMEYHRGVNLEQFVGRQKPRPRQAAVLVAPLARALGAAHRRGIIHQDVKPANIVIDETAKPYLVDFGLARLRDAWSGGTDQAGGGTPTYMAPEQARAEPDKVGPASDIFALGSVLYFLLTGNPPFVAADWYETQRRAARCEFDRSALRGKGIPRRLAAICLRAMAAEPADRYPRAEDFAAALERYQRGPRRLLVWAVAFCLLAVLISLWHFWPKTSEPALPALRQPLITTIQRTVAGKPRLFTPDTPDALGRLIPLRPGDKLEIGCDMPRGFASAMFLLDTAGSVRELEHLHVSTLAAFDRIRFPAKGVWHVEGPPGTLLVLVCANRRSTPRLEDVRRLIQEKGSEPSRLPAPEENVLFLLNQHEVPVFGEVPREVVENAYSRLKERLERLRGLALARFDHVWGVAVPVR